MNEWMNECRLPVWRALRPARLVMSLGLIATASLLRSLLCITFCHISRPCFLLASALELLALTWGSRAAGLLWDRTDGPGRPRAKKAGNAPRLGEFLDDTWLPAGRRRKKWGLVWQLWQIPEEVRLVRSRKIQNLSRRVGESLAETRREGKKRQPKWPLTTE